MGRIPLVSLLFLMAACQDNYVEEVRRGVFVERSFMFRVEGTLETGERYNEFCNEKTNKCYLSDHKAGLETWFPLFHGGDYVLVNTNNIDAKRIDRTIKIFRTRDGVQLGCSNCGDNGFEHPLGRASISEDSGDIIVTAHYSNRGTEERRVYGVSIRDQVFSVVLIETVPSGYDLISPFYARNGEVLWIDCRSGCQLVGHRLDTGERRTAPAPTCDKNEWPIIQRKNGIPTATCRNVGPSGTPIVRKPESE